MNTLNKKTILKIISILFIYPVEVSSGKVTYSNIDSNKIPFDIKFIELIQYKKNGFFLEVGAHDGVTESNTKLLEEKYGWKGILIEPSKNIFEKLCKNRPYSKCFQCCLGSFEKDNTYAYGNFDGTTMSSLTGRTDKPKTERVLIKSLQSILDEEKITHINFFSLDTEGYEYNILQGIDYTKTTFDYLLIEIYKQDLERIVSFLKKKGYNLISCFSNYNKQSNPIWDGSHNDYLFKKANLDI